MEIEWAKALFYPLRKEMTNLKDRIFAANLASNVANFSLSILIGFWYTPYLIGRLGISDFGFIPLSMTVVSYMSIFTLSINSSVSRFMTVAMIRNDANPCDSVNARYQHACFQ